MALAPGSGGRRKERLLLKEKCSWLSHQRAPLGERASSSCMGNGQLIHLEIDSGCGAPRELGGGTWSRAGCWCDMGQAAEERGMLLSGVRLRSRWSLRSRGLVCLLLSVLLKRGAALVIFIHSLPRVPSLQTSLGLIRSGEPLPNALGCHSALPPLSRSSRFIPLVCGLARSSGVSSNITSSARGLS